MLVDNTERCHNSLELSDSLTTMHLVLLKEEIRNQITLLLVNSIKLSLKVVTLNFHNTHLLNKNVGLRESHQ